MTLAIIAVFVGLTVVLAIIGVMDMAPNRPKAVSRRLSELRRLGYASVAAESAGRQDRRRTE